MACVLIPDRTKNSKSETSSGEEASYMAAFGTPATSVESPVVVTKYKGDRTHLRLRVESPHINGNSEIRSVGAKTLSVCNTFETFLKRICEKCLITEASIAKVVVTFPWHPKESQRRESAQRDSVELSY